MKGAPDAFALYADWYNAFNQGKDYAAEASYVLQKVKPSAPSLKTWLDIGCGTGSHLACLATRGISVSGVDISPTMVAQARSAHPEIPFFIGSAQDFHVHGVWDVVSMLFHVMSYQTTDAQVRQALSNISGHMDNQGVLVFDFWHTAGVLRDPPGARVRQALVGGRRLFRLSRPVEDRDRHHVHVHYEFRWDSSDGVLVHQETHTMRHFAPDELEQFLSEAGFTMLDCTGWLKDQAPASDDWYGLICARRGHKR